MRIHIPLILAALIGIAHSAPFDRPSHTGSGFGRNRFKAKEGQDDV